jgi:hypothetical protein
LRRITLANRGDEVFERKPMTTRQLSLVTMAWNIKRMFTLSPD